MVLNVQEIISNGVLFIQIHSFSSIFIHIMHRLKCLLKRYEDKIENERHSISHLQCFPRVPAKVLHNEDSSSTRKKISYVYNSRPNDNTMCGHAFLLFTFARSSGIPRRKKTDASLLPELSFMHYLWHLTAHVFNCRLIFHQNGRVSLPEPPGKSLNHPLICHLEI